METKVAEDRTRELDRAGARERLSEDVRLVWGERSFLFRVSLIGFVCGLALAFLIPVRFTSTTQLMPPENQSTSTLAMAAAAMSGRAGGLGQIAGDLLGVKSSSDLFVGILSSRTMQERLIERFDLRRVYSVRRVEDARKALAERTGISVDRKSQIISISVADHSPQRAAAMAQAYIEELDRLVAELSTSSARRERVFLENRLQSVSQDLEAAEKDFSQFSSKNGAIDIKEQGKAMVEAAATLQGQLISAESEFEGLRQIYSDTNVRVRAVKARIEELRRQLDKLGGRGEGAVGPETEAKDLYPSIRRLPLLGVTYADLYRRTKVQEAVYEALTQEYELAKVQEAKEIPTVKVLDAANIPERKDYPPRAFILFLSTAVALSCGVMFLLISNHWERKDPRDMSKVLANEMLLDLKEKGLFNSRNGSVNGRLNGGSDYSLHPHERTWRILGLLDLRRGRGGAKSEPHREGS